MLYALIILAALSRLLPHPPNFTPIAGMALFGAAVLPNKRVSLLVPLAALLLSDVFLGFYDWFTMLSVYGATLLVGVLGNCLLRKPDTSVRRIAAATLSGSVLFFLVTNTVCWWTGYPRTAEGLAACYIAALPFFRNEVLGTLVSTAVFFGGQALFMHLTKAKRESAVASV